MFNAHAATEGTLSDPLVCLLVCTFKDCMYVSILIYFLIYHLSLPEQIVLKLNIFLKYIFSPFANYRFDSIITHFLNKLLPFLNHRLVPYRTKLAFANAKNDELKVMYRRFY